MVDVSLIKESEGFAEHAYKCPAGKWTVGYGSTRYQDGTPVKEGDTITQEKAEELLHWYCDTQIKYPEGLNNNQKSALCSLIYNIGMGAFDRSQLKKAIEAKNEKRIREEWTWYKANGKALSGLVKRRQKELNLFFKE